MNGNEQLPDWLTYRRTVLFQKDQTKGNAVENYCPISCLPLMWKHLTDIIFENLYSFSRRREDITRRTKRFVKGIAEELKIRYFWIKQCLETGKGEVQTLQWLG